MSTSFQLPSYHGKTVAVLGLGPRGMAAAAALVRSGAKVVVWDAKLPDGGAQDAPAGTEVVAPAEWLTLWLQALVVSDGHRGAGAADTIRTLTSSGVSLLTDFDLFNQGLKEAPKVHRSTVVLVSGALGKSVTAAFIAHILTAAGRDVACGGNEETPLLSLPGPRKDRVYVIEVPLQRCRSAVHLSADYFVSPVPSADLDRDRAAMVLATVQGVLGRLGPSATAIVGADTLTGQKICMRQQRHTSGPLMIPTSGRVTLANGIFARDGVAYRAQDRKTTPLGSFQEAPHSIAPFFDQNAAAAVAVALQMRVPAETILRAVRSFRGLTGRFEWLGAAAGISFIDDSHARQAEAVRCSLRSGLDTYWVTEDEETLSAVLGSRTLPPRLRGVAMVSPQSSEAFPDKVQAAPTLPEAIVKAFESARQDHQADPDIVPAIVYAPGASPRRVHDGGETFRTAIEPLLQGARQYG